MSVLNTVTMIVTCVLHHITLIKDCDNTVLLVNPSFWSNSSPKWFGQGLHSQKVGAPKTHFLCVRDYPLLLPTSNSNTVNSPCSESRLLVRSVGGNVQKDTKIYFLCLQLLYETEIVSYLSSMWLVATKYKAGLWNQRRKAIFKHMIAMWALLLKHVFLLISGNNAIKMLSFLCDIHSAWFLQAPAP